MGRGFTWESDDLSRDRAAAEAAWAESRRLIAAGEHAVVILDELTYVIHYGFVPLDDVLAALARSPAPRDASSSPAATRPSSLAEAADVVTEMRAVKHPFDRGKKAVPGLDY